MLSCENALKYSVVFVTKHTLLALFCSILECFIHRITATTRKSRFHTFVKTRFMKYTFDMWALAHYFVYKYVTINWINDFEALIVKVNYQLHCFWSRKITVLRGTWVAALIFLHFVRIILRDSYSEIYIFHSISMKIFDFTLPWTDLRVSENYQEHETPLLSRVLF